MIPARQLHLFRGKRQKGALAPLPSEFAIHCAVADSLRVGVTEGWLWTHFPAGELRDKVTAARLQRMGTKPGFADFLLIDPDGCHYWLELKKGKAPLNDAQLAFRDGMCKRGVPYAVARSLAEALQVLQAWGAIRVRISA